MLNLLVILSSVVLSVLGQLLVKHGINCLPANIFSSGLVSGFIRIFLGPWVVIGSCVYVVATLLWIYALTRVALSFAYPFVSISYVLIIMASRFVFGEPVSALRWVGVIVICAGIILVSRT